MNHPHACRHCSRPWSRETFRWGIIFFATMLLCSCQAPSVRTTITDDGLSVESLARIAAPAANPSGAILRADDEPTAYPETASTANYQVVVGDIASNADRTIPPRGKFLTRPNEIDLVGFDGDPLAEACGACDADGAPCPWRPPGIKGPWPRDEYLCDGGDDHLPARVDQQWNASGIDLEDTVGHYDTLGGSVEVVASNRVCIYAPRFAAVRKVSGAGVASALDIATPIRTGEPVGEFAESTIADGVKQPIATVRQIGTYAAQAVEDQQKGLLVDNRIVPHENREALLPYEDFQVVSTGLFDTNDKPRLATSVDSALTWSLNQAVQLVVDGQLPLTVEADGTPQTFVQYELQDRGRMRIIKLASQADALPGEIVDFTLRFDNVGDLPIGNVTLIDSLTTRLEYVKDSQQCSKTATFSTKRNEGESLQLRWEITEPLEPGQGGVIRFQCRVR